MDILKQDYSYLGIENSFISATNLKDFELLDPKQQTLIGANKIKASWSDMRGRRKDMQDSLCFSGDDRLFAIFDGHGGRLASEFVSNKFTDTFGFQLEQQDTEPTTAHDHIISAFKYTFKSVDDELAKLNLHEGTAALVAFFCDKSRRLYIANAGDSRAVMASNDEYTQRLSTDHKPSLPSERERIMNLGGYISDTLRVNGTLTLTRSLGDFDLRPYTTAEPTVSWYDIDSRRDRFIIMACDGVWDVLSDDEAVDIIRSELLLSGDINRACGRLKDYAFFLGSGDNISVMVLQIVAS